jgi:hypothetical protein
MMKERHSLRQRYKIYAYPCMGLPKNFVTGRVYTHKG